MFLNSQMTRFKHFIFLNFDFAFLYFLISLFFSFSILLLLYFCIFSTFWFLYLCIFAFLYLCIFNLFDFSIFAFLYFCILPSLLRQREFILNKFYAMKPNLELLLNQEKSSEMDSREWSEDSLPEKTLKKIIW